MITEINESKRLTKHISCECKCRFDGRNCNSDQWWSNDNVDVNVKNIIYVRKIVSNPATCNCENGNYLASITDDSAIMGDEIIESYDYETNFNEKKANCKASIFCLHFY